MGALPAITSPNCEKYAMGASRSLPMLTHPTLVEVAKIIWFASHRRCALPRRPFLSFAFPSLPFLHA